MLTLVLVPVLLALSMLAQRPVSRILKMRGPLWPLIPISAPALHCLAIRGAGMLFTFALVIAFGTLQASREQNYTARVAVPPGLAAAEAGMQTGDLVTAVDGAPVSDFSDLRDRMLEGPATKTISVRRGEESLQLRVTLKNGLLGVKALEEKEAPTADALVTSFRRFFSIPAAVVHLFARPEVLEVWAPQPAQPAQPIRVLAGSLMFSQWLMFAVELLALALASLAPAPPRPN